MSNVAGMMGAQVGGSMLERLFTNWSETDGTGRRLRAREASEDLGHNRQLMAQQLDYTRAQVGMARDLGIHPSVILGSGASTPQIVGRSHVPSQPSQQYGYGGQSVSDADKVRAEKVADQQIRLGELRIQSEELGIARQQEDLDAMRVARTQDPVPPVNITPSEITAGAGGETAGRHHAFNVVQMPDGTKARVPNTDVMESGELMPILSMVSDNTGIPLNTLQTLVSYGLLVVPGAMGLRTGIGIYRGYRQSQIAKKRLDRISK